MTLEAIRKAVMAGLGPAVYVLMAATAKDVDARHDGQEQGADLR
jgi:hypothetical protein